MILQHEGKWSRHNGIDASVRGKCAPPMLLLLLRCLPFGPGAIDSWCWLWKSGLPCGISSENGMVIHRQMNLDILGKRAFRRRLVSGIVSLPPIEKYVFGHVLFRLNALPKRPMLRTAPLWVWQQYLDFDLLSLLNCTKLQATLTVII